MKAPRRAHLNAAPLARATTAALAAAAATAAASGFVPAGAQAAAALPAASTATTARTFLTGTHPSWAVRSHQVASPAATLTVTARVYLAGRDPAGLAAYAAAVATPGSTRYRKFLTTRQERERYGPTAAQVTAVQSWLAGAGLRVTGSTQHYVAVTGPASAADSAFAVRLADFRTPTGAVAMAPEGEASVPAAVGTAVLTVTGLDTAAVLMHPALLPAAAGRSGPGRRPGAPGRPAAGRAGTPRIAGRPCCRVRRRPFIRPDRARRTTVRSTRSESRRPMAGTCHGPSADIRQRSFEVLTACPAAWRRARA